MADLGAASWSEVDASNSAVPPNGWPEGMAPSDVNNAARAQMGGEKRWYDRSNSTQTTTGTLTAYILTYTATQAALYDGEETSFILHLTCGATPSLNRDGLGAKTMRKYDVGTAAFVSIAAGDFKINQVLRVRYNLAADRYDVISASFSPGSFPTVGTNNTFTGTNIFANTVTMSGAAFNEARGADIASAATTDIGAATGNYVRVTGTTTITALGTVQSGVRRIVEFTGALTLTYDSSSLVLPTAANITTAAGDVAVFVSKGSGNWKCVDYERASGVALAYPLFTPITNSLAADVPISATLTNFTGPSIAQGTAGTWWVSGQVTIDMQTAGSIFNIRLWDGTTVIDSAGAVMPGPAPGGMVFHLSGYIANPAGNIRITLQCTNATTNIIRANLSGYAKDSTLSAIRIA